MTNIYLQYKNVIIIHRKIKKNYFERKYWSNAQILVIASWVVQDMLSLYMASSFASLIFVSHNIIKSYLQYSQIILCCETSWTKKSHYDYDYYEVDNPWLPSFISLYFFTKFYASFILLSFIWL